VNSNVDRSNPGSIARIGTWSVVPADISHVQVLPFIQQEQWCPGSPVRHIGQEQAFSSICPEGRTATMDKRKLLMKEISTSLANVHL
jgi:hypothetical protein